MRRKLFAESKTVTVNSSVAVMELADNSLVISGIVIDDDGNASNKSIRLSTGAVHEIRLMLNQWSEL